MLDSSLVSSTPPVGYLGSMPIRWDPLLVRHLAGELDALLRGARLRALRLDAHTRDLVLLFKERTVVWRLHPDHGAPMVREAIALQEADHRLKARVRSVRAPSDERIIIMELGPERTGQPTHELVVELIGTRLNAFLIEGEARTVRHLLRRREGARPARVGLPYGPPRPTGRRGVDGSLPLGDWLELLEPVPPAERARELVRTIAWASPLNAGTFLGASPLDEPGASPIDTREELVRGYEAWVGAVVDGGNAQPVLLDTDQGPQPYGFPLAGYGSRRTASLLEAFEACAVAAGSQTGASAVLTIGPRLLARLEEAVDQAERRLLRLRAELDGRDDPDAMRALGDLILARYTEIPRGATKVTLSAFDGEDVEVELDPTRAPHENASMYYDRAGRSERAAERLPGLIDEATAARDRLSDLLERAGSGETDADVVRDALPRTVGADRHGDRAAPRPYLVFRSTGGLEIRVGRGAKHNDDLTFRHSAPDDVWLHARHAAGAHVILRWAGEGAPPPRDLHEAGVLAALHSKARTSGSVPVDWTRRKYVRKPRGAAPGSVVPERVGTIFVEPDEGLLETLAADG
jgi:hypothetical protein